MSRWLLSKHSRAYAVLAQPESKQIAELSGIPLEPQRSTMCLGCHATGTFAEAAEKDDTFFAEDGVQCEMCHGPGSEHVERRVTKNAAAIRQTALPKLTSARLPGLPQRERLAHGRARSGRPWTWTMPGKALPIPCRRTGPSMPRPSRRRGTGYPACSRQERRPPIYRRDGLRQVPPGSESGVPVQPVAVEQACPGLCRALHLDGLHDGPEGRRRGRSRPEPRLPEVPCHGISRRGRRRAGFLCSGGGRGLRGLPWRGQRLFGRGDHATTSLRPRRPA